jgi:hypothetical protein
MPGCLVHFVPAYCYQPTPSGLGSRNDVPWHHLLLICSEVSALSIPCSTWVRPDQVRAGPRSGRFLLHILVPYRGQGGSSV